MKRKVMAEMSKGLHDRLKSEKQMLQRKEAKKVRSRRRRITMWDASQSLLKRLSK